MISENKLLENALPLIVPVNDAYIPLDGKLVLETNDSFKASAGAGTTLKILLSVLETAN